MGGPLMAQIQKMTNQIFYGAPRASPWSLKDAHVGRHPDHTMAHSSTAKAVVFCLSG